VNSHILNALSDEAVFEHWSTFSLTWYHSWLFLSTGAILVRHGTILGTINDLQCYQQSGLSQLKSIALR